MTEKFEDSIVYDDNSNNNTHDNVITLSWVLLFAVITTTSSLREFTRFI